MATVDFCFDFQSPWAYFASTQIEAICTQHGAALQWQPVELERLRALTQHTTVPYSDVVMNYLMQDAARWAQRYGVPLASPITVSSTPALRGCFHARNMGCEAAYIHRVFRSRWADRQDLSDEATIRAIATDCGLDYDALRSSMADPDAAGSRHADLEGANEAAAARGVFGVPTTVIDTALFWGNDRLDFVAEALATA